eukprot:1188034-Prorocentrum_minimum.AAC.5
MQVLGKRFTTKNKWLEDQKRAGGKTPVVVFRRRTMMTALRLCETKLTMLERPKSRLEEGCWGRVVGGTLPREWFGVRRECRVEGDLGLPPIPPAQYVVLGFTFGKVHPQRNGRSWPPFRDTVQASRGSYNHTHRTELPVLRTSRCLPHPPSPHALII